MASELTENSATLTEFAGKHKLVYAQVAGSTNTDDYYEVDEVDTVDNVIAGLDAADADKVGVKASVDSTTSNRINIKVIEQDGTTCTQNAPNVNLQIIGH